LTEVFRLTIQDCCSIFSDLMLTSDLNRIHHSTQGEIGQSEGGNVEQLPCRLSPPLEGGVPPEKS
jgi:hypothetical protein